MATRMGKVTDWTVPENPKAPFRCKIGGKTVKIWRTTKHDGIDIDNPALAVIKSAAFEGEDVTADGFEKDSENVNPNTGKLYAPEFYATDAWPGAVVNASQNGSTAPQEAPGSPQSVRVDINTLSAEYAAQVLRGWWAGITITNESKKLFLETAHFAAETFKDVMLSLGDQKSGAAVGSDAEPANAD